MRNMSSAYINGICEPQIKKFFVSQKHELILLDKAYGLMLVKQGMLSAEDYRKTAAGLDEVDRTMTMEMLQPDLEDLYFNITTALYQAVGQETGCLLHIGRSRNDLQMTCNRMEVRKSIWQSGEKMLELMAAILQKAKENLNTVITYYTFGQPSQPGTYAHYLMTVFTMLSRDFSRLKAAYANTNRCPMGAAAGIGSGYPVDRQYLAQLLGFDCCIVNTADAVATSDYILDTEYAFAMAMQDIGKFANDLSLWSTDEFHTLDCDFTISSGSSIMPQKKNPVGIDYARAKCAHAAGRLSGSMQMLRSTSVFPNVENTMELLYFYWENQEQVLTVLDMIREVLLHSKINAEHSYNATIRSFTWATTLAEVMTNKYGIPFTETHEIVGAMIRKLMENNKLDVNNFTAALMAECSNQVIGRPLTLSDEEVRAMMDPIFCLEQKVVGGTPKASDTEKLIADSEAALTAMQKWLKEKRSVVENAYAVIAQGI